MIKHFNFLFVTMFGLGRIGFIPGTFGSLATVIIRFRNSKFLRIDKTKAGEL